MPMQTLTLQTIIHDVQPGFWKGKGTDFWKLHQLRLIGQCGTGACGWSKRYCGDCTGLHITARGCHNRNCPTCVSTAGRAWVKQQEERLIQTHYFHVVFTIPAELRPLARAQPGLFYGLHMRASKDTILAFYANRKQGYSIPSILQTYHTWSQPLDYHPHAHMVVSGGGYQPDTDTWIPCPNPDFLAPGPVLARAFRDQLVAALHKARAEGKLIYDMDKLKAFGSTMTWEELLESLHAKSWNVHIKKPFGGPKQVVRYLARYTHRTAISNRRILKLHKGKVTFGYLHRKTNMPRTRTMTYEQFLTLFALHIPPKGFHRVRGAGLLAPNCNAKLAAAQEAARRHHQDNPLVEEEPALPEEKPKSRPCPFCGSTNVVLVATYIPDRNGGYRVYRHDSGTSPPTQGGTANTAPLAP